jgi:glucokinase
MRTILAADIGATNCRFALFRTNGLTPAEPLLTPLREKWLAGKDYKEFRDVLQMLRAAPENVGDGPFLSDAGMVPDIAVLAPAGPVEGDCCRISNLPWVIRAEDLREQLGIADVRLINDFAAQAYACLMPECVGAVPILPGLSVSGAPVAVAGAGTGFGQALIIGARRPLPTKGEAGAEMCRPDVSGLMRAEILPGEGGHCDFPFAGKEEQAFADFVRQSAGIDRIIGDTVVSGSGLAHIFAYLTGERLPPEEVSARLPSHPQVLEWYARFYGRACRNYVLATLALGGLYITGGMALRAPVLLHPAFAAEFHHSAAQERLLRNIPVFHVRKPEAGLWGAALYGLLRLMEEDEQRRGIAPSQTNSPSSPDNLRL